MTRKRESISGSSAILGQALLLFFFIPFCLFLLYLITRNFTFEVGVFILLILVLSILMVIHAFTYSDLSLEGDNIIIKKLFYVKYKPIVDYKTVDQAIMPFKYCIKFQDGSKACFILSNTSIFRHIISSDPDRILKELRTKFQQLQQEHLVKK